MTVREAMGAFASGVLAVGGTLALLTLAGSWLWSVGTGEVSGWIAIPLVLFAIVIGASGIALVAMIGAAMDEWNG